MTAPDPALLALVDGESCVWTYDHDGDYYATDCGEAFCLVDGNTEENNYRFCPACGKRLVEVVPDGADQHEEVTDGD